MNPYSNNLRLSLLTTRHLWYNRDMKKGGIGGGRTITGLDFENRIDLLQKISQVPGYRVDGDVIYFNNKQLATSLQKHKLYRFLESHGIDYSEYLSKKLLPDDALFVPSENTLYVIEMKFQSVAGSVDEKLQTCDFKKKHYTKLLSALDIRVEYVYILSEWFEAPSYKDVKEYILSVGCKYYIETLPFAELGFPMPAAQPGQYNPEDVLTTN